MQLLKTYMLGTVKVEIHSCNNGGLAGFMMYYGNKSFWIDDRAKGEGYIKDYHEGTLKGAALKLFGEKEVEKKESAE